MYCILWAMLSWCSSRCPWWGILQSLQHPWCSFGVLAYSLQSMFHLLQEMFDILHSFFCRTVNRSRSNRWKTKVDWPCKSQNVQLNSCRMLGRFPTIQLSCAYILVGGFFLQISPESSFERKRGCSKDTAPWLVLMSLPQVCQQEIFGVV